MFFGLWGCLVSVEGLCVSMAPLNHGQGTYQKRRPRVVLSAPSMSCTPVTDAMADLLDRLAVWPDVDTAELRTRPEWDQAQAWGWIMESGELTGTGLAHVMELPGGIVKD